MGNAHQMIQNQQYRVCIKREADAAGQIDSFGLGPANANPTPAAGNVGGPTGVGSATCAKATHQFITVQPIGRICGGVLSPLEGQAKTGPVTSNEFGLTVTAPNALATQPASGFNLIYNQVACN